MRLRQNVGPFRARTPRLAPVVLALALISSACGGGGDAATTQGASDDDGGTTDTATASTSPAGDTTTSAAPSASSTESSVGAGLNQAFLTLEGDDYTFDAGTGTITDCNPDFFGSFWVIGESADGGTFSLALPLEQGDPNLDPPSIRFKDPANDREWIADIALIDSPNYADVISAGDSQVNDYTVDGSSVIGNASFVDENEIFAAIGGTGDDPVPVEGAFAVQCDPDGGG